MYGAIFSKNRFFGTTHGDKPTSQNGISLRSPSLIMAPAKSYKIASEWHFPDTIVFSYFYPGILLISAKLWN